MKISFKSTKLAKSLSEAKKMKQEFGKLAKTIPRRLATLAAAPTLDDVPKLKPDRCHQLTQDKDERFAVDLSVKDRLIFDVDHDPIPRKEDGRSIDLKQVTAIVVTEVSDHYA